MEFSAQELIAQVRNAAISLPDKRTGDNSRYSMEDIVLSAFSVFFTQSPSFLSFQRAMQEQTGRNNAQSLFTVSCLPDDNRIRTLLDGIPPDRLFPIFTYCFAYLVSGGLIESFKSEIGYLIALDGTGYFSSDTIHCVNCLTKTDKKTGKVTYYHSALTPVLIKPGDEHVLSLPPEFILPQDGDTKQDCENKAAKRWLWQQGEYGRRLLSTGSNVTILGDDLYSRQPVIKTIKAQKFSYILVCKRESHKWLYDWVDNLEIGENKELKHTFTKREWTGTFHKVTTYQYTSNVPLKDSRDTLMVNWFSVTVVKQEDGSLLYHNAFVTDQTVTDGNVANLVTSGRARWKIENENNNTLKTKGYHFEHNYGHGDKTLSLVLLTLILVAFFFHTILDLCCEEYRELCASLKRQYFFSGIRELLHYFYVTGWEHLFIFMKESRTRQFVLPTVPFATLPLAPT
jgi:hypothetical protein